jgi:ribosomal protein L12E/L44/L45/RPP1/RPP2
MRTTTRSFTAAIAATLLIAACGSDSNDTGTGAGPDTTETTVAETTPETTPDTAPDTTEPTVDDTTTTEAPAQDVAADTTAAEAALLTLADFPEGWTEAPSDGVTDVEDRLAECIGVDSLTSADASAASADFSSPDGNLVVTQSIGVTPTEQDARLVLAGLTNPDVPECLAAAYNELGAAALGAVAEGATLGEATASRLAVGAAGDATQAIRVEIPAADGASTITVDHVVSRSGRSISALTFVGRIEATAVETIDSITEPAAARLPA